MNKLLLTALFAFGIAMGFFLVSSLSMPSPAMAHGNCGGLNQRSCWSLNPKDYCDPGLKMVTKTHIPGSGRCVRPVSAQAAKKKDCGGLNQRSCWSLNPKDYCDPGLEMVTKTHIPGSGRCVTPKQAAQKDCGGLNQKSCWSFNPKDWCQPGLKMVSKFYLPGSGRCVAPANAKSVTDAANRVFARFKALGPNNALSSLMNCLHSPGTFGKLQAAMTARSTNGVNSLLAGCHADRRALRALGLQTTGLPSNLFHIELGGTAVAVGGVKGGLGYVVELSFNHPRSRFYLTGGLGGGPAGENGSADISIGYSHDTLPNGVWATDQGKSVDYSGHFELGGSVSVDFPGGDSLIPNGLSIGAGGGFGVELNTVFYTMNWYP